MLTGAFAEEAVVPARSVTPIPPGVDDRSAAAFGVAHRTAYHVLRALRWGGRFVTVGYASGTVPRIPLNLVLLKGIHVLGFQLRDFAGRAPEQFRAGEAELQDLLVTGQALPHAGSVFGLHEAAAALRLVADGQAIGKVMLDIGDPSPGPSQGPEAFQDLPQQVGVPERARGRRSDVNQAVLAQVTEQHLDNADGQADLRGQVDHGGRLPAAGQQLPVLRADLRAGRGPRTRRGDNDVNQVDPGAGRRAGPSLRDQVRPDHRPGLPVQPLIARRRHARSPRCRLLSRP
jgi:hypothetical protein